MVSFQCLWSFKNYIKWFPPILPISGNVKDLVYLYLSKVYISRNMFQSNSPWWLCSRGILGIFLVLSLQFHVLLSVLRVWGLSSVSALLMDGCSVHSASTRPLPPFCYVWLCLLDAGPGLAPSGEGLQIWHWEQHSVVFTSLLCQDVKIGKIS